MDTAKKVNGGAQAARIILNTELVRAISENGQLTVYIRMTNGQWAIQRPFDADLRGQIAALTLALDALTGKIILTGTTQLDEREFDTTKKAAAVEVLGEVRQLGAGQANKFFGKI